MVSFAAPLLFSNADVFRRGMAAEIAKRPVDRLGLVVLEALGIAEVDYTAAQALREVIEDCRGRGIDFAIARLESARARRSLERFGVLELLGADKRVPERRPGDRRAGAPKKYYAACAQRALGSGRGLRHLAGDGLGLGMHRGLHGLLTELDQPHAVVARVGEVGEHAVEAAAHPVGADPRRQRGILGGRHLLQRREAGLDRLLAALHPRGDQRVGPFEQLDLHRLLAHGLLP